MKGILKIKKLVCTLCTSNKNICIVTIFGVRAVESQSGVRLMTKNLLEEEISRSNAPSAEVI